MYMHEKNEKLTLHI